VPRGSEMAREEAPIALNPVDAASATDWAALLKERGEEDVCSNVIDLFLESICFVPSLLMKRSV